MTRGCLTNEIKEKYNITLKQLRLLPYFQYLLMNGSRLDASKIDAEERVILQQWRDEGKITFSISEPCTCTKEFWDWMNEILWESYVPHKEDEDVSTTHHTSVMGLHLPCSTSTTPTF